MRFPAIAAALISLLAILFIAGITHIVTMLAIPEVAANDAYSRLVKFAAPDTSTPLPPAVPGHELAPYSDPAMAQAVCLYDLKRAPMRLTATADGINFLSLSFRTRGGRVFYSMTDLAAVRGEIEIVVMTQAQLEAAEADDDDEEPTQELRLVSQTQTGFVLIQALVGHPLDRAAAEARVRAITCASDEDDAN